MRRLRFALFLAVATAPAALAAACGGDPPEPGFEEVGGSGEGAGGPSSTKSSGSGSSKASGNTTAQSTASSTATSSNASTASTGSSGCNDTGSEPNDSESTAVDLGGIGDCDDEGGDVSGVLDGATDPDWYKFKGTDASATCTTDPNRSIVASHPIRICKFVQCDNNEANDFDCPSGTMNATSPDGRPGCCSSSGFEFSITCGSSSINADNATVYIRVDTPQNDCVSYTLSYAY